MSDPSARVSGLLADSLAGGGNAGSLRVLRRAGFEITGVEISYAPGRGKEIEETILRLET
jgi:hypothetical protein